MSAMLAFGPLSFFYGRGFLFALLVVVGDIPGHKNFCRDDVVPHSPIQNARSSAHSDLGLDFNI